MDKTNAMLYEAKINADENRSKEIRQFSASVVEAVEELQGQLSDAEESNKAVERALADVDYRGTYADGVLYLKQQLAAALAACEAKDEALENLISHALSCEQRLDEFHGLGNDSGSGCSIDICNASSALSIQPDSSVLKAHGECATEINNLKAEVERLKDLLRTSFMDDHLRIELHFKDYHIRKLVKPDQHINFLHVIGVIARDMWEDLRHALVRNGVIK